MDDICGIFAMLSPYLRAKKSALDTVYQTGHRTGITLLTLIGSTQPEGPAKRSLWQAIGNAAVKHAPRAMACLLTFAILTTPLTVASSLEARGETRTLKVYFIHTGEKAAITFKKNGRYDAAGLQQLNRFLRDWRRNEPTKMDPRLFDLVWEVYTKSGSRDYIHVVSAYRSPNTNNMLRSRTKGVAKRSQHMLGKAMDFYLPDVKLKTLREIGMRFQVGGVGYYPTSGSPFVHMDVGSVRAWPRMSRNELVRLFPDGKTMHLPADGKPLPGFDQAVADYKRRVGANTVEVAGGGSTGSTTAKRRGLLAMLFNRGGDEDEEPNAIASGAGGGDDEGGAAPVQTRTAPSRVAPVQPTQPQTLPGVASEPEQAPVAVAAVEPPAAPSVNAVAINAPVPLVRPAFRDGAAPAQGSSTQSAMEVAMVAPPRNAAEAALAAAAPVAPTPSGEFADLSAYSVPVPALRTLPGSGSQAAAEEMMTASATPGTPAMGAASAMNETSPLVTGFIPVPSMRPAGQAALAAVADATVAVPTFAPRTPASTAPREMELASLPASRTPVPPTRTAVPMAQTSASPSSAPQTVEQAVALSNPDAVEDGEEAMPETMAAVSPDATEPAATVLSEDTFTKPETASKGARPKKQDAEASSRSSIRTEPKVNKKIISQWALTNGRVESLKKPVTAPQFVSKQLRTAPTTVYSAGFSAKTTTADAGRFTGTAVNFMEVKKFSTN